MKLFKAMKKFGFVAMTMVLAASLSLTGCSSGDDDDPVTPPAGGDETILTETPFTSEWNYTTFEASKFTDVIDGTKIVLTVSKAENDYQCLQFCLSDNSQMVAGTLTEASLNANRNGFVPSFNGSSFSYIPTTEEWTSIKSGGLKIQGHGVTVSKIVLVAPAE